MTSRRVLEIALVTAAILLFYAIHLDLSRTAAGGDWANLFWPMKEFRNRSIIETGEFSLWCPYVFMGMPFAATMQHAVYYPLDYLFAWLPSTFAAMNLTLLLHLALAGVGAWWWTRVAWRLHAAPAVMAGILFPCTAWFWGHQEHLNQIAAAAWMPWLMGLAILRARNAMSRPAFIGAYGLLAALQLLVGHPQGAFYTHFFAGLLLIGHVATTPGPRRVHGTIHALIDLLLAGAIAGLAASVQLIPAMELQKLSYRQFAEGDPSYALTFSMPPDQLIGYAMPGAFGSFADGWQDRRAYNEYGVHVGRITLLLAFVGFIAILRARRHRTAVALGGGIALALLMALGGNASIGRIASGEFSEHPASWRAIPAVMQDVDAGETPPTAPRLSHLSLHEALLAVIPPMRGFRAPARALVVTGLLWVTLAAFGLQHVLEWLARRRDVTAHVPLAVAVVLPALLFADLYLASRGQSFRYPVPVASLMEEVARDRALYDEPTLDNRVWRFTIRDADLLIAERQRDTIAEVELEFDNTSLWARWMRLFENNNAVIRVASTHGYEEGLAPTVRTKDFFFEINRNLRAFTPDAQLLAILGVSRVWTDLPPDYFDNHAFPLIEAETRGPRRIHAVIPHRGAAFWEEQAEGINFAAFEGPHHRGIGIHPRGSNTPVDYGIATRWNDDLPRLTTDVSNPNRVLVQSSAAHDGTALLTMAHAPGWSANGEPVEWISAVHARVTPGVPIEYRPASHRVGLFLSVVGFGLIGALLTAASRQSRTAPHRA